MAGRRRSPWTRHRTRVRQLEREQVRGNEGRRTAGLQIWDRADTSLGELVDKLNAANKIADPAAREKAVAAIRAAAPPAPRRLFAGKTSDRSATIALSDASGKVRLTLTVDADGNPRIEFLDEQGKVVSRLPQK